MTLIPVSGQIIKTKFMGNLKGSLQICGHADETAATARIHPRQNADISVATAATTTA